ncbi:hypothetical protein M3223_16525 [Paenibacillus pasadenensis]|uniref:hypothetical protein n=1 Tax=Paenibacillus pasadenensis TaxID=217090 RepID=UPI00204035C7|nr:hypothetical protein [Paenibacillus pasadenensis]MCM3748962.1 hypothetical protein [Paenibacillus pasadenensis]
MGQGSTLGFILVLFILLVIVTKTFGTYKGRYNGINNGNENDNGSGALDRENFRIVNNTSSITFTYNNMPGAIQPSPTDVMLPRVGENFFELPFVLGSWISRTMSYTGTFPDGSDAGTLQFTLNERNLFVNNQYYRYTSIDAVSVPPGTAYTTSSLRLTVSDGATPFR